MKVLIIRFSSIGDIVLTTPVVKAISEQMPNVEIHYITKKSFASLLSENPHIQKLYTIEKSISEVIDAMKQEQYDLIIDLHKNIRTLRLKQQLGVKSYSFNKLNFQKWLLVNLKLDKMPDIHIVDRYFGAAQNLGIKNNQQHCELHLDERYEVDTQVHLQLAPYTYLSVAIGAQFATKTMPINLMVNILKQVESPIVLLGGPTDIERGEQLHKALIEHGKKVYNAVNKFSLLQSASIVKQSKVLLTHDTGLMHIATAFSVPIVSIWGNTVPELGMYPYYPENKGLYSIHEVKNLNCRPCSKIGYKTCPKKHFNCMTLQNVDAIVSDINKRMKTLA